MTGAPSLPRRSPAGTAGNDPKLPYGGLADQFPGDSERGSLRQTAGAPAGRIRRYGDYCGERLRSIVSVSSFSSDALYLNHGRC